MPKKTQDEMWYGMLAAEIPLYRRYRHLLRMMPSHERCKNCNAPFNGIWGLFMRLIAHGPYTKNPRFCNYWFLYFRRHPGGAEVDLTLLFVDVRGSTSMAERMSAAEFSELMNRFYRVATDVLIKTDAFIDKLIGDEVMAVFLPIFAGKQHAQLAIRAAQELLRATGHDDPGGPWVPVGVGVHSGPTYFCAVTGAEGSLADFTALGDNVNIAARLAANAGPGEALISDAAYAAAGLDLGQLEKRQLDLKGKGEPVGVSVMRAAPD